MSKVKNDMMPIGMPPVMVDYEDFSQFMAQEERLKEQQDEIDRLKNIINIERKCHVANKDRVVTARAILDQIY